MSAEAAAVCAEAERVLTDLGLGPRVAALPKGLHTLVEESGLSEGERQLLSLARALVAGGRAKLRILLCDEPTSNVDFGSDAKVMDALLALNGVSVVLSAHRLQHLRRFERVCVMDKGTVEECGPPEELLADEGSWLSALANAHAGE